MKIVKFANFDSIENVINEVVEEHPSAKVECVFGVNGNGLGIIIDTNEINYNVNINVTDKTVQEGMQASSEYKICTVKKLPEAAEADGRTLYILSSKDGERTAGTAWSFENGEFVQKSTDIGE